MSTQIVDTKQSFIGFMDFTRLDTAVESAKVISKAPGFCPSGFLGKPEQILCAIQYGMEIGLSPFQAINSIAVINGKVSIYGDGLMALCQSSSELEDIREEFDNKTMTATCTVKRKNRSPVVNTFSKAEADAAGLTKKEGPWRTYTKRMLQMRARGFALRDAFADRLKGIITAEEARDYPEPQKQFQKVTPINNSVQMIEQHQGMTEETRHRLFSLMEVVYLSAEELQALKTWAKVNRIEDMSESRALTAIARLEAKLAESMRQDEHKKALMVRNGCEKCNNKPLGDYFCECEIKTAGMEPGDEPWELGVENEQVVEEEGEVKDA